MNGSFDAIVVGARVAGAATAMLLARGGARVLCVDRARRGSDTLSTHALMRGGVAQLARWGLLAELEAAGTPPIRRNIFHYGTESSAVSIKAAAGWTPSMHPAGRCSMRWWSVPRRRPESTSDLG